MTVARVTQQYVEVAAAAETRAARVTQQYVEAACLLTTDPVPTTSAATDVTEDAATLNGSATMGEEAAIDVSFQYRVQGAETWLSTTPEELTEAGTFSAGLTSLDADTDYEFRAAVEWGVDGVSYGDTLTFHTSVAAVTIPLYLGSQQVVAVYLGSTEVTGLFFGGT